MRIPTLAVTSVLLASACGKKEAPAPAPVTTPATTSASADAATAPAAEADAAPTTTAAEADAAPATAAEADAAPATTAAEADAAPAAEAPAGDDLIVWTDGATGAQTVWLHGKEVIATRPEPVALGDGKLWALGKRWREIKVYACGGGEDGSERDPNKAPELRDVATLVAKELGGATERPIRDSFPDADTELDGEIWGASVDLVGSIGATVFSEWQNGLYGCGAAHGLSDAGGSAFDLAKGEAVDLVASEALKQKVADALTAEAKKQECLGDGETVAPTAPSDLQLGFVDGRAEVKWSADREADAEWNHACDLDAVVTGQLGEELGYGPVDPRVAEVVATTKGRGSFGFSTVPADARDRLLEVFRKEAPTFGPPPAHADGTAPAAPGGGDAKALVAAGRKLTRDHDLKGAIASFDAAIAKDPAVATAWSGRGYAKLLAGDATAKADFEKALTLDTKDVSFQAAVWFNLGQVAEHDKDLAAAKKAYAKAVELKPSEAAKKALERVSK